MDKQLVLTAICLLLRTGLYVRMFKDWDLLAKVNQTWIKLCHIIQEAFQHHLNATAPTSGHHGYAPPLPYMMNNTFGALGHTGKDNKDDSSADTMATGVAVLTVQSQLMANTVANMSQRQDQLYQHLAHQQTLLHANHHQI